MPAPILQLLQVMQALQAHAEAVKSGLLSSPGVLRDHRSLVLTQKDHERIIGIPKLEPGETEGKSMRDAPGMVVHANSERLADGLGLDRVLQQGASCVSKPGI